MSDTDYARQTADLFFRSHDPTMEMRRFRNFIPEHVLKTFCGPNMWVFGDETQMHLAADSELLTLFHPEQQDYERAHWSTCFGKIDIYASYFDNLSPHAFQHTGIAKFQSLQRVDREIYQQLTDPIWNIHGNQSLGEIPFSRDDINTFRKFLYLMTSLGNRERNMHLLAHHEFMENARIRRRKFIENNDLEHARDVWLRNAERMLDTPHHQIPNTTSIFDLDRVDYKANAVDRYMVFWEAGPGDEFILTDSAFGGFEGGQIGAKKNSTIDMTPLELEQHLYTRDFMWHQIYVLSPTLAVALCHPTLMHPELTKQQRKRWGLRKSLLEALPHTVPHRYYKDMKKGDLNFEREGLQAPIEVDKLFASNNVRGYERRRDEDVVFNIHRLSSAQVAMVNSVLLHNQELGPKIQSVCVRPPGSYQCFHRSLRQFQLDPWPKYSEEVQNDYEPLLRPLEEYLSQTLPPTPPNIPSNYPYQPLSSSSRQMPMFDRPTLSDIQYSALSTSDVPAHLSAHSSLTPSSHSSYNSFSSASSQSSNSTRTTSIDTPRSSQGDGSVRRSNTSGKSSQRSKAEKKAAYNHAIEKAFQEAAPNGFLNAYGHDHLLHMNSFNGYQDPPARGRNPAPVVRQHPHPHSNPSSKRTSPNPTKTEQAPRKSSSENSGSIPQKKNYATEATNRSSPPQQQQFPPPAATVVPQNGLHVPTSGANPSSRRRSNTSPLSRSFIPDLAPPPPPPPTRRVNHSPEHRDQPQLQHRPSGKRNSIATEGLRYEPAPRTVTRSPEQEPLVDARGRRYEPIHVSPAPPITTPPQRPQPERSAQQQQMIDGVRERLHQVINQPEPATPVNRSPDAAGQTAAGNVYQMVAAPTRGSSSSNQTPPQQQQQQQRHSPAQQQQSTPPPVPPHTSLPLPPAPTSQASSSSSSPRNSATTEHPTRPGVEIVRGRSLRESNTSATSSQPSKPEPQQPEQPKLLALTYPGSEPATAAPPQPIVKQLRFETPVKELTHKYSDLSIAGSMLVQVGDTPTRSDFGDDDDDSGPEGSDTDSEGSYSTFQDDDDDDASWEDEGFVEADDHGAHTTTTGSRNNKTKMVRFAGVSPLLSRATTMGPTTTTSTVFEKAAAIRKGMLEIEGSPRAARRVEIPRPLSRNGQRGYLAESRRGAGGQRHGAPPVRRV